MHESAIEAVYIDLGDGRKREIRSTLRASKFIQKVNAKLPADATTEDRGNALTDNIEGLIVAMLVGTDRDGVTEESIGDLDAAYFGPLIESATLALTRADEARQEKNAKSSQVIPIT